MVRITFSDLHSNRVSSFGGVEREPLARLLKPRNGAHVHGRLNIEIDGRSVPHLGHFGLDDVCFGTWAVELSRVVRKLGEGPGEDTFDEGEQGQPAFRFVRAGDKVALSITASTLSEASADPAWQGVACSYDDLREAVVGFLDELRDELRREAPEACEQWWSTRVLARST